MDRNAAALMDAPVATQTPSTTRRSSETPKVNVEKYQMVKPVVALFSVIASALVVMYQVVYKAWAKSISQVGYTLEQLSKTFTKREVTSTELTGSYTDIANHFGIAAENILVDPTALTGLNPAARIELSHQFLSFADRINELNGNWGGAQNLVRANRPLRLAAQIISQEKISEQDRKAFASALNATSTCFRNEAETLALIPTFIVNGEILAQMMPAEDFGSIGYNAERAQA